MIITNKRDLNIVNTPTLETDRLLLRKFNEGDLNAMLKMFGDKEINKYLPWFPVNNITETKEFYKNHYLPLYKREAGYHYAICLKDKEPIGWVNVSVEESMDLGYGLIKEYWNQGIVSEACLAVLEQVKNDGYLYVTATHDINNIASGKVMQKLKMKYMYSYQENWQPKNKLVIFRMYQLNFDNDPKRVFKKYWDMYPVHFVETGI